MGACENCTFWRRNPPPNERNGWGECRRFPPVSTMVPIDPRSIRGGMQKLVPALTPATYWCGEYKPRLGVVSDDSQSP
jgi:hypothetical protein